MNTRRRYAANLLSFLKEARLSEEKSLAILHSVGIPDQVLNDPSALITSGQEFEALLQLVDADRSNMSSVSYALRFSETIGLKDWGVVGLAASTAPNLFEAFKVLTAFPELVWGALRATVQIEAGQTIISVYFDQPVAEVTNEESFHKLAIRIIASTLFVFSEFVDDVTSGSLSPDVITIPDVEPTDWNVSTSTVASRVKFAASEATLVYNSDMRDVPIRFANAIFHKLYLQQAEFLAKELREGVTAEERVARHLWSSTPIPTKVEVANHLGMSVRSLSRALKDEDSSFQKIFSEVQEKRAIALLQNTDLNIANIAYRLGYSDQSSFARSFKARTGKKPSDYRL